MYAKTCAIAFIAVWLFNASLAAPAPEPEPEAQPDPCGFGCGCGITKVRTVPICSNIPIKTTHQILPDNNCGGFIGGYGGGYGYGGLIDGYGYGGYGCGGLIGGYGYDGLIGGYGYDGLIGGYGGGYYSGCGNCAVTKIQHIPVTTHVPIKTTHRVIPQSNCGYNSGSFAGYGYGCGCGC